MHGIGMVVGEKKRGDDAHLWKIPHDDAYPITFMYTVHILEHTSGARYIIERLSISPSFLLKHDEVIV